MDRISNLRPHMFKKHNSYSSDKHDEDISDIICMLYPSSDTAQIEVQQLLKAKSPYLTGRDEAGDEVEQFESDPANHGSHAIILRLSSQVHSPVAGFVFGRHPGRCDIVFVNDPLRRISNIHFRIYVDEYGRVMIEDFSTNGTFVDDRRLGNVRLGAANRTIFKWMLSSGSLIRLYLHNEMQDLIFRVRIPLRTDEYLDAYQRKVDSYFLRHNLLPGTGETVTAVDLLKNDGQLITQQPERQLERQLERQPSDQCSPTTAKIGDSSTDKVLGKLFDMTQEIQTKITAPPPTDSGYASTSAAERKLGMSMRHTGIEQLTQEIAGQDISDTASEYSDESRSTFSKKQGFVWELANELFKNISSLNADEMTQARISNILPELLQAFALKIGYGAKTQMHRDVMAFVHRYRR